MSPHLDTSLSGCNNLEQNEGFFDSLARAEIHIKRGLCGHTQRKNNMDHRARAGGT